MNALRNRRALQANATVNHLDVVLPHAHEVLGRRHENRPEHKDAAHSRNDRSRINALLKSPITQVLIFVSSWEVGIGPVEMDTLTKLLEDLFRWQEAPTFLIEANERTKGVSQAYIVTSLPECMHIRTHIHAPHVKLLPDHGIWETGV